MSHFTNTACEIGCRMWRSSRCGRATTLFAKLLKQTTSNYFTKSNLSVTVSQRHRQLSAARWKNKLLVITSPKVICQSLWARARDIDTCRKRSSTILWESGSKSAGEPNPRLGVRGLGSQHSTSSFSRRSHTKTMEGSKSAGDPNPRLGSSKSASVFGWGIQIRGDPNPRLHMHMHEWYTKKLSRRSSLI